MGSADKLTEMVTTFTQTRNNLSGSLVKIDEQITDLTEQWQAISYAQDGIETDLETYVETNKSDYFYTYGSFGVSGTGELKEWMGFDEETGLVGLTYESANSFLVTNDETGTFTPGTSAVVTNGGSFSVSTTVSGSMFNLPWHSGQTLVVLDSGICQASLDGVYLESYANSGPLWDSDATVISYMGSWATLDGFITNPVGLTGTYGIEGRLSNLYVAKGVVTNDYNKYKSMVPILTAYAP